MRNAKVRKYVLLIVGLILALTIAIIIIIANSKPEQPQKISFGTLTEDEASDLAQKLETTMQENEKLLPYYGGCYIANKKLVVCLTSDSWIIVRKIKKILEEDENIHIKKVDHSQQELETVRDEVSAKWQELLDSKDEKERQLGEGISTLGVYIMTNQVRIGIRDYSDEKVAEYEKYFGNTDIISYALSNVMDVAG